MTVDALERNVALCMVEKNLPDPYKNKMPLSHLMTVDRLSSYMMGPV